MKILITGSAGFIGYHLAKKMLELGNEVVGIDNINDYYDVNLKYARLAETGIGRDAEKWHTPIQSLKNNNYRFIRMNLEDRDELMNLFKREKFEVACNLAAQAGVRYSLENPFAYINSNIIGFINLLEACRHYPIKHFVFASSSSVYGTNIKIPYTETDQVDHQMSLYAATKKSNELMAFTYSHLYNIPMTGLRYFTVYGPWGRPDMSPILFATAITKSEAIKVYNNGDMERDFTYIDDIVESTLRVIHNAPDKKTPFSVFNVGNGSPVNLMDFIHTMEKYLEKEAQKIYMPIQPGDVRCTWANVNALEQAVHYRPQIKIDEGVRRFVEWFKEYSMLCNISN